jgi:hypothetical protein
MSDKTLTPAEEKLKEEVAEIVRRKHEAEDKARQERTQSIAEKQKAGPDLDQIRRNPLYKSF